MNDCSHPIRQKDNYGETCLLCGETLAGYGYQGTGQNHCHHLWILEGDQQICRYCGRRRSYNPEERKMARALIRAAERVNPHIITLIETWLVANVSPKEIGELASSIGSRRPEQWYLMAEYFYDVG